MLIFIYTILIDYLRELFHKYKCEAKWMVFLDADVLISDFTISIESIITIANTYNKLPKENITLNNNFKIKKCQIIAQLSPSSINTGILFFHITSTTETLLNEWMRIYLLYHKNARWQDEQVFI